MITGSSNPQIRRIIRLQQKARARHEAGLFAAEGVKLFRETPEALREAVYVSESFERERADLLSGVPHEILADHLFAKVSDTQTPQGILTLARMPRYGLADVMGETSALIVVLENVQDPGNVGTILRTAEAAGVTGLILGPGCADLFQPKVIRATMGSVFRVPFVFSADPGCEVARLKERGVRVYAAHLGGTKSFTDADMSGPAAVLIGNEGNGLTDALTALADELVRIPMEGQIESLNAAVAASLLMYEAHRQRADKGVGKR